MNKRELLLVCNNQCRMWSGRNPSLSDEVNRQSNAIAKRREHLRRWDESETKRESSNIKLSQRVKFEQVYIYF